MERNYAKAPLERGELEEILALVDVASVLNTRHEKAKAEGWKQSPPSKAVFIAAALEDNNLLRRPITVRGKRVVVGADAAELEALLGG